MIATKDADALGGVTVKSRPSPAGCDRLLERAWAQRLADGELRKFDLFDILLNGCEH